MSGIWLTSLPTVLRDAGLQVDTYPGWETRARSTGGYDAVWAVQCHHTASSTSPASDMAYMWDNSPDRPVGAIYLARDGRVTVGAAGATNTSGKGGPLQTSRGSIPLDAANRYVISIEAANAGTGEAWPDAQIKAYQIMVKALCTAYSLQIVYGDVHSHWEWTTRKIDPAGTSPYATGGNKWDMNRFRQDVANVNKGPTMNVWAGWDTNGTNYNKNGWVIDGGGAGLVLQNDGSLRAAQLRNGVVTLGVQNDASYNRPHLKGPLTVPFEVSGEIFLHSRMTNPWILGENRAPTWEWAVNVYPVFVDEDNNIVTGFAPSGNNWSASGQTNGVYGIARATRYTPTPFVHDQQFGAWHKFKIRVPVVGTHEVYWDDVLVYRVEEKTPPASWWNRPLSVGLRLDFYDYSLRNLSVGGPIPPTPPIEPSEDIDMFIANWKPGTSSWTALVSSGPQLAWVSDGYADQAFTLAGVKRVTVNDVQLSGLIKSAQTTTVAPPTLTVADRNVWNANRA